MHWKSLYGAPEPQANAMAPVAGISYGAPMAGRFDPTGSAGALSGQPQGPLSGNGGFFDQLWPAAAGAALLAGPSLRVGLANAASAIVPALQQDRRRNAINAWLKAKSSGGQLDPATLQLLQSDPNLGESVASSMLTPHPKQLAFDRFGRGYIFQPFSGEVQPLAPSGAGGAASDGGADESIAGLGQVHFVPMSRLLGRPQKIGTDASGQTIWRDPTGQMARGPAATTDTAQRGYRGIAAELKSARDALHSIGGLKPGDDPSKIQVPGIFNGSPKGDALTGDPALASAGGSQDQQGQQWYDAGDRILRAARAFDAARPDSDYIAMYMPQPTDKPATRGEKMRRLEALVAQADAMGGGQSGEPAQGAPAGTPPAAPPRPATVPPGSAYHPGYQVWRSPDRTTFFDLQGNVVR